MSNWLLLFAVGFLIGAATAGHPRPFRPTCAWRTRRSLASSGLRPGLRVHIAIHREEGSQLALLTVHISNRTKDMWWLRKIEFPAGAIRALLESDSASAGGLDRESAVAARPLLRCDAVYPNRPIHPDHISKAQFVGLADGTYEHVWLRCSSEREPVAIELTLQRSGRSSRPVLLKAVRFASADHARFEPGGVAANCAAT